MKSSGQPVAGESGASSGLWRAAAQVSTGSTRPLTAVQPPLVRRLPAQYLSNPFATRFVAPGVLTWLAPADHCVAELARRFTSDLHGRGLVVGPHGSGKSSLLAHLVPQLQGRCVSHVLRRGQRPYRQILAHRPQWRRGRILVLDGLEQLWPWEYALVRSLAAAAGMGLLATAHRPYRSLPTLVKTAADVATLQQLVARLLSAQRELPTQLLERLLDPHQLGQLLAAEQGSVREVFMRLYDVVEEFRSGGTIQLTTSPRPGLNTMATRGGASMPPTLNPK